MRKLIPVFFGLGGFLLVAGLVAAIWAPGAVKKTPIDVSSTTYLTGQAGKLDTATGELVFNPVRATSITKSDSKVSDEEVVTWTNTSCLVIDRDDVPDCVEGDDDRLITASTDVFATDRETGLAVNKEKYLPADAEPHEGLVNKWPFDAQKKTYPYWDGTAGEAVEAKYVRTVEVAGLETYLYRIAVEDAEIEVAAGVPGTYDDVKEIFVEPRTGSIVNQTDNQQRTLADGTAALDLKIAFTDEQVKKNVSETQEKVDSLGLITRTVPLIGVIGGLLFLGAGAALLIVVRRRQTDHTV